MSLEEEPHLIPPMEPARASDPGPFARLRERLGLAPDGAAARELESVLGEQVRASRQRAEERADRGDAGRDPYNAAVFARVDRLVTRFGAEGASAALERTPFYVSEVDGSFPRLALVNGRSELLPSDAEPTDR